LKRLIVLILIFISCDNVDDSSLIIEKIPDKPILILSIDKIDEINYQTINFISESTGLDFNNLNILNPSNEVTYSFHKSGKNKLNGILIQKSNFSNLDSNLIKDTINYNGSKIFNYDEFYISNIEKYTIISKDKLLIENVLRGATFDKNDDFNEFKNLHLSKTKNISLNASESFRKLKLNFDNENISQYSNWIQYEFDFQNNDLYVLGISEIDKKTRNINILNNLNKSNSDIIKIIPNNFSKFKRMSFKKDVIEYNYNNSINQENSAKKELDSIFYNVKELGEVIVNDSSIIVFSYDNNYTDNILKRLKQVSQYRNQLIYSGRDLNLSDFDILDFRISKNYNYISNIENNLILTNNLNVMQNLILNYNNKSLATKNENFKRFLSVVPSKTTFYEIINNDNKEDYNNFQYWFTNYEIKNKSFFKSLFTTPTIDLNETKSLNLKFSKKLNSNIISNPTFVNNYRTGNKNIIFQDANLNLILLDLNEEIIFEKKLKSKIISEIFQVDLYKNKRLQFVFITNEEFIVLDIKGNFVKKIKLEKSNSNKFLSVFDYDKNRNYRFIIQNGRSLKMLDRKFKIVKGFKKTKLKSEILKKLKHLRVYNKDYLIIIDKSGSPQILDRRGNVRIKLPKKFNVEQNNFFVNSGNLITINTLNQLVNIQLDGTIIYKQLPDEKHLIYANKNNLLIKSEGKISINNNDFNIPYGNYTGLNIFEKKDKTYYYMRDIDKNTSFLFDQNKIIDGFPIFSKSDIDLSFEKNQDLIALKGDDNEILLYTIN
tara:strand:- start:605 stop:2920 length:2316 start_codon:yes stop_codon:yes gene_type:complete